MQLIEKEFNFGYTVPELEYMTIMKESLATDRWALNKAVAEDSHLDPQP